MILKDKHPKKRKLKTNLITNTKTDTNTSKHHLYREPAFRTNKTIRKYILDKLEKNSKKKTTTNKQTSSNKKYKIEVNRKIKHSKSAKIFNPITIPKNINTGIENYIYYKKNSKISFFLNSIKNSNSNSNNNIFNTNRANFSENNSYNFNTINNIGYLYKTNTIRNDCNDYINTYGTYTNNFNYYKEPIKHKYSNSTFSSTISYKEINFNNNIYNTNSNNKVSDFSLSPSISSEKNNFSLTSRLPYRRVGNIFNRTECHFSKNKIKIKIKNNIDIKNKLLNKCKSLKYYEIYPSDRHENSDNKNKTKELKEKNIYLKKMVKMPHKKINMKKAQLERLLMLENQVEDKNCPIPMKQIKKIYSSITDIIERKIHAIEINKNNKNNNLNTVKENIQKEITSFDYLEEPFVQAAPKPYILNCH